MNYNYQSDRPNEPTYLSPKDTSITVEGYLQDVENIETANGYAEYYFSFNPYTMTDDQRLMEHLEQGKLMLDNLKPSWSNKVAKLCHLDKKKQIVLNQLFPPKLNVSVDDPSELYGRVATITLHLRDDPTGSIYLNAEYVNVRPVYQPKDVMMRLGNDGDYLSEDDF